MEIEIAVIMLYGIALIYFFRKAIDQLKEINNIMMDFFEFEEE